MSSSESEDMFISHDIGNVISNMIHDIDAPNVVPEKSKHVYEACYSHFTEWLKKKNFTTINEKVILAYFMHKSTVQKPTSLWAQYSKLRTTINVNNNVDISKFKKLLVFLKIQSNGYVPKNSKSFTKSDIDKFLLEADDEEYLLMKVVLIIGVIGACRRNELVKLAPNDIIDMGDMVKFVIQNTTPPKEFIITDGCLGSAKVLPILRKYMSLRSKTTTHDRFFVSCRGGKCTAQPVGANTFAAIPRKIATYLGLPEPDCYTATSFRQSSDTCYTKPNVYPGGDSTVLNGNSGWAIASVSEGYVKIEGEKNYAAAMSNATATSMDRNISGTVIKEEPNEDVWMEIDFSEQNKNQDGNHRVADGPYNHTSLTNDQDTSRLQDEATDEMKYFNSEMLKKIDVVVEQQRRQNDQLEKMNSNLETLIELLKGKFAS